MMNLRKPLVTLALASSALGLSLGVGLDPADAATHAGTTTTASSSSSPQPSAASSRLAVASLSRTRQTLKTTGRWNGRHEHYFVAAVSASWAVTGRLGGATSAGMNKAGPLEVPTDPSRSTALGRALLRRSVLTGPMHRQAQIAGPAAPGELRRSGSVTITFVPATGWESIASEPWWAATMAVTIERPSPEPEPARAGSACQKRSEAGRRRRRSCPARCRTRPVRRRHRPPSPGRSRALGCGSRHCRPGCRPPGEERRRHRSRPRGHRLGVL